MEEIEPHYSDIPCDYDFGDFNDGDVDEVGTTEQIFNFLFVPSFFPLFSGGPNESFYFV